MGNISGRGPKILVVEDNPADVRLIQEVFSELAEKTKNKARGSLSAYEILIARDGEEALVMLHKMQTDKIRPDLVLLDLNLPRKDGREVLSEMKSDPELRNIPVVILSTSRAERDVLTCYNLHANCYLQKPVDFAAFANMIESMCSFWFSNATLPHPHGFSDGQRNGATNHAI